MKVMLQDVYDFWFNELSQEQWFQPDDKLDRMITERFGSLYDKLRQDRPDPENLNNRELLGLVILFDQFPRNMFRGSPRSFESDPLALDLCKFALARQIDLELDDLEKSFLYMPLEHSEDLKDQELCVSLFESRTDLPAQLDYARQHRDLIEKFGRFPHRNEILGRESTEEEKKYLQDGGETFGTDQ